MHVVAAIIEDLQGRILLAQRPEGKPLAGQWEFPGGKIEEGESPDQALVREIREELRMDISIKQDLGQFEYRYSSGPVFLHVFVVRANTNPQLTSEVAQFNWVDVDNVTSYNLAPADLRPWFFYLDQT